ncbi:hypothetical protein SAY87_002322 [Trapa incisa]|uniref:Alpha/beta hydrolase fold-3 domain-containing protein n=1 Tax=Trapa incisa TaxID=236973 RepID=A0AAN7PV31_9MYRT|nr:hypothetical protein SAY87_002322 [Trapa incisa]
MASGSKNPLAALPWPFRTAVGIFFKVMNSAFRPDGTVNRRLINLLDWKSPPTRDPVHGVSSSDITVDPSRNLWFRLFVPAAAAAGPLPVIVYFHGGGFAAYSPASRAYDSLCRRIAGEVSAVVASFEYRLTPEYRFPCQYDDGIDTLRFIAENTASLLPENADLTRCFFAGDSAGGNLAHHVAVRAAQEKIGQGRLRVEGLIAIQPFFGGSDRTESEIRLDKGPYNGLPITHTDWLWRAFLPEGADRDHWAANVSGPNAVDISGLADFPANTIIFAGGADPLHDWQVRYYEWLKRSGHEAELVEFAEMGHGFYAFADLSESAQLMHKIKEFVTGI